MTDVVRVDVLASPSQTAEQWAPVFKALGDPVRLEITLLLAQRPRSVKELQEALGHNQALVSHHLRLLREQGVVTSVARGRSNVYEIQIDPLSCLTQCLISMTSPYGPACTCPQEPAES
ncbi:ArsR/SmtB family transcription factor [Allorhizocola rhizosphaerae]|uniref:ArsR/SmtB family transcription factor n=1 Tax=Allorhizocola rhizosphaerae TaxID=1872709 RepID=UPI000E3D3F7D|nr:metalloregulator ArsR/SmtB family transcription factor [Allorhizocola rhizosphaerae]